MKGEITLAIDQIKINSTAYDIGASASNISFNKNGTSLDATNVQSAIVEIDGDVSALGSNKVDKVTGKGLSTNDFADADKTKLNGIETGAQVNTITGVKGSAEQDYRIGNVSISKADIGLANVDNTSDVNKPISTATQNALNNKVDKVTGKGLSTEDYTTAEKDKLDTVSEYANHVNVTRYVTTGTKIATISCDGIGTDIYASGSGGSNMRELTQAEYDALTTEEKNNGTVYYITDGDDNNGGYQLIQPIIYSEEEREVGVWTDGKPLYQKTFSLTTPSTTDDSIVSDLSLLQIDVVTDIKGVIVARSELTSQIIPIFWSHTSQLIGTLYFDIDGKTLRQKLSTDTYLSKNEFVTIQYTKTTDVAGSGKWTPQGTPAVHYSTEEQVVGTWVDGSVIYEKTVIVSNMMIGYDGTIHTSIPHNISNFGYAISLNILCPKIGISSNNILVDGRLIAEFRVDDTNIYANSGNDHYGQSEDRIWYFTIQYTKTTT